MKRIRIGNNIKAEWTIKDESGALIELKNYSPVVSMYDPHMQECAITSVTDSNPITILFKGKDQLRLGNHTIVVQLQDDNENPITTIDSGTAFELVAKSHMAGGTDDNPDLKVSYGINV